MSEKPSTTEGLRAVWARASGWSWLLAGGGAAMFALRLSLEAAPQRAWWGLGIAALCFFGAYAFQAVGASRSLIPLGLLWVYVLWPTASPAMALGVGFVGVVGALVHALAARRVSPLLWDALLFVGALVLYLSTLAPDLLPADSGEFQIVGPLLGVAHPPGYALFTLLAKGFSLIPIGTMTWRLNLTGAVMGALTLVVVSRTARRFSACRFSARRTSARRVSAHIARRVREPAGVWAGIAAAGALGLSTTFWAQSTTINIRMLTMLSTALCLATLVRFLLAPTGSREGVRALTGLAASFGLAIAHTAWPAFFAPAFGIAILWHDPAVLKRVRLWPRYLAAFALPFLGHLYIVVRAITGAPFGTEELVDVGRVIDHLLGRGFGGDMFAYLKPDRILWERTLVIGNILHFQFGLPLLVIALAGFAWLARKRGRIAVLLGSVFSTMAFIVATYRAPQSVEYLMPAYLPIALSIGAAVAGATTIGRGDVKEVRGMETAPTRVSSSLLVAALLLPILLLSRAHLPSYQVLHRDRSTREYAESLLLDAPPEAHILSNWHWYTPLRYLQLVEGRRPDVQVTYLYPRGATAMPQAWPQRIEQELQASDRPLIVTNYYPTYGSLPHRFEPLGEAYAVHSGPSHQVPDRLEPINVDLVEDGEAVLRLIGYRTANEGAVRPGDQVTVDLVWQPLVRLECSYAFFVHLVGADGVPLGQQDHRHDRAPTYEPGEVLVDRYRFPVYLTAAPGSYSLIAGAYLPFDDGSWVRLTTDEGKDALSLGTVSVVPSPTPAVTVHPVYLPFVGPAGADAPTLLGVDYDDTLPGQRRVYLHWRAGGQPAVARLYAGRRVVAEGEVPAWPAWAHGDAPTTGDALPAAYAPPMGRKGYVTTALDVPPGTRDLRVAVQQDERAMPARLAWGIPHAAPQSLPDPGPGAAHYMPFGGKLALIGVRVGSEWRQGAQGRVALRFLGLRPIVRDYVVSVGALGSATTDAPSDWVPALGAMPTFKWIRGSTVNDVHLIRVLGGGEAELTLGIYDAFTAAALPPLDERFARQGRAGIPLKWVSIP